MQGCFPRDLNLGPHAYTPTTLPTRSSLQERVGEEGGEAREEAKGLGKG